MTKPLLKIISWQLIFALFVFGFTPDSFAGLISSERTGMFSIDRNMDLQKVQKVLESKMVQNRLENLGFSQKEIQGKLNSLDENQMHLLAQNLDELKVGGGGFEIVVVILLLAIAGLLWLHINKKTIAIQNQ